MLLSGPSTSFRWRSTTLGMKNREITGGYYPPLHGERRGITSSVRLRLTPSPLRGRLLETAGGDKRPYKKG